MISDAIMSPCRVYRYHLSRIWDQTRSAVAFVMLNPSTATAETDDPTIRRCIGFARDWGFGGLRVVNLFALRATDPRELMAHSEPVGPDNEQHIAAAARASGSVVVAWGANPVASRRSFQTLSLIRGCTGHVPMCLGLTVKGFPRHPLYVRKSAIPVAFDGASS